MYGTTRVVICRRLPHIVDNFFTAQHTTNRVFSMEFINSQHEPPKLPDDVIFEHILPRLPVKSLTRFKCVSKYWCSFISTPYFAKCHLKFSSNSCPQFLISKFCWEKIDYCYEYYSLAYNEKNNCLKELVLLDCKNVLPMQKFNIIGCCNGLVCLHYGSKAGNTFFAIWNPATHQYRKISPPYIHWSSMNKRGFGYASSIDDYKIIVSESCAPNNNEIERNTGVWIFSVRLAEWKRIDFPSCRDFLVRDGSMFGVYAGDCVYWEVPRQGYTGCSTHIFSLNLVDEQFTELPIILPTNIASPALVFGIQGCLLAHDKSNKNYWKLKQNYNVNSWEDLFSINYSSDILRILNFAPGGKCLVKHMDHLKLVDITLKDLEQFHGIEFRGTIVSVHQHVESLISPFGVGHV